MHELYEGIKLDDAQATAMCRGLLDLAAVDGVDESEIALIHEFHRTSGRVGDLEALAKQDFDLDAMAKTLRSGGDALIEAFVITCYLLIHADGHFSDAERKRIGEYGEAFGLDAYRLEHLHTKARLFFLAGAAAELRNPDAVRAVGKVLGLSDEVIEDTLNKED